MNYASKEQISKIHVLLNQQRILAHKKEIVSSFSGGRTESTKGLTMEEARNLIQALVKGDPGEKMRGKIFALAYETGIIYGNSFEDKKINGAKLNMFLLERGTVKKELNKMNQEELLKTVNQFQKMANRIKESKENKTASEAVISVLAEVNETFIAEGLPAFELPFKTRLKQS